MYFTEKAVRRRSENTVKEIHSISSLLYQDPPPNNYIDYSCVFVDLDINIHMSNAITNEVHSEYLLKGTKKS